MLDGAIKIINGITYRYDKYYDRLETNIKTKYEIGCPKCLSVDKFSISYGYYECLANCQCGNSFTIYYG